MNILKQGFKQTFKRNGAIKLILLGVGLALGLVLIAKVYFEKSYDSYIANIDRTYKIISIFETQESGINEYGTCSGAIAPGIKHFTPAIECATRYTPMFYESRIRPIEANSSSIKSTKAILADTSFFEIFSNGIVAGESKMSLNSPNQALISLSLAKKLSKSESAPSEIMGQQFIFEDAPQSPLTIAGVYNDFPINSSLRDVDVVISLGAISKFMPDGSNLWFSNARYHSVVKLAPNASVADINTAIAQMCEKNLPHEQIQKSGYKVSYRVEPIADQHSHNEDVKRTCSMLLILAITVLATATLNYVLITISAMVKRSKNIALHRCYGANRSTIYKMLLSESFICIVFSLGLSLFIVFSIQSTIENLLGNRIDALFSFQSIALMGAVCILVILIGGLLPGQAYSKISVGTVFQRYKESNRKWKHVLLLAQFICSSFFIILLTVVGLQYKHMINFDPSYSYKNVASMSARSLNVTERTKLKEEIAKLSFVKEQSFSSSIPIYPIERSRIQLNLSDDALFMAADMLSTPAEYFNIFDISIIEGRTFNSLSTSCEALVSRSFADKLMEVSNLKDGVVGTQILVSGHQPTTICGIYEDYHIGNANSRPSEPSIHFNIQNETGFLKDFINYYTVKLDPLTPENIAAVNSLFAETFPNKELEIKPYAQEFESEYKESRKFMLLVIISGIIVLIITLIGLIGYSHDEINRRRSEIAIRKINGASIAELLNLFLKNVSSMGFVGISIGVTLSFWVATRWMEQFTYKINITWWLLTICAISTLLIIAAVVVISTYKAANANPVNNLKSE